MHTPFVLHAHTLALCMHTPFVLHAHTVCFICTHDGSRCVDSRYTEWVRSELPKWIARNVKSTSSNRPWADVFSEITNFADSHVQTQVKKELPLCLFPKGDGKGDGPGDGQGNGQGDGKEDGQGGGKDNEKGDKTASLARTPTKKAKSRRVGNLHGPRNAGSEQGGKSQDDDSYVTIGAKPITRRKPLLQASAFLAVNPVHKDSGLCTNTTSDAASHTTHATSHSARTTYSSYASSTQALSMQPHCKQATQQSTLTGDLCRVSALDQFAFDLGGTQSQTQPMTKSVAGRFRLGVRRLITDKGGGTQTQVTVPPRPNLPTQTQTQGHPQTLGAAHTPKHAGSINEETVPPVESRTNGMLSQ